MVSQALPPTVTVEISVVVTVAVTVGCKRVGPPYP